MDDEVAVCRGSGEGFVKVGAHEDGDFTREVRRIKNGV